MAVPDWTSGPSPAEPPNPLTKVPGDPLLDELFPHVEHGIQWGLERMEAFLRDTGDPHLPIPCVHVGGTNGKGSVASTVASVLNHAGHRVGLYTSPHLCAFRERFQIAGDPVEDDELRELAQELDPEIRRHSLTFFEATTGLAFHLFQRRGVEVSVIEVGLGGRLDATNVVAPFLTAITNVDLDHCDYLGSTLNEIALEKAGIIKKGVPLLTAERDSRIRSVLSTTCDALEALFIHVASDPGSMSVDVGEDHTAFDVSTMAWGRLRLRTPLPGDHQAVNGALAVALLERMPPHFRPERTALVEGLARVNWPGRVQVEHLEGRTWVFDIAHNTAGAAALASVLGRLELPRPLVILTAVLGDKDWREMLPPLFAKADHAVLTQAPSAPLARRWDPQAAITETGSGIAEICTDFDEALDRARELAGSGTIVVTGSAHTVGDAMRGLGLGSA
ncbi:MAG: bifunctional folylpolyglutamate synthase/dihydrofolate synthase [Gemmatimonadetes bacterium]|nr:bifunctional folylpolyglutamate synthase/dihydrofolate synthase [Gemmatimonadota bacterium]